MYMATLQTIQTLESQRTDSPAGHTHFELSGGQGSIILRGRSSGCDFTTTEGGTIVKEEKPTHPPSQTQNLGTTKPSLIQQRLRRTAKNVCDRLDIPLLVPWAEEL